MLFAKKTRSTNNAKDKEFCLNFQAEGEGNLTTKPLPPPFAQARKGGGARFCSYSSFASLGFVDKIGMPRIAGVNIPDNKQIEIALTYIYGIGRSLSRKILLETKIDSHAQSSKLSPEEVGRLREIIEKERKIEGELRREKMVALKRLKDIGCWRGIRHIKGLPVRGQQTQTNTRTVRGNVRKTVGSGKKAAPAPK